MQSIPIRELENILLHRLRTNHGCESIRQVTVIPRERGGDWICGCVQAGDIDPQVWRYALTNLETKYRQIYRLASRTTAPAYKIVKLGPDDYSRGY